jgi:signal transduction histidine kinase
MLAREMIIYSDLDQLPPEAAIDVQTLRPIGPKSAIVLPSTVGGEIFGAIAFDSIYEARPWPPELIQQLQFVADILGHALERKRNVAEFLRLQNELAHVSRVATLGELTASLGHELNQPLGAILSNVEAVKLLLASAKPDTQEIGAALEEIAESDIRATEIIKRFRVLFKRGELKKSLCSPVDLFEAVQRVIKSEAAIRSVAVVF